MTTASCYLLSSSVVIGRAVAVCACAVRRRQVPDKYSALDAARVGLLVLVHDQLVTSRTTPTTHSADVLLQPFNSTRTV